MGEEVALDERRLSLLPILCRRPGLTRPALLV